MKIYFDKENGNNQILITDGKTVKCFDALPSGIFEGVDLYADDTVDKLRRRYQELEASGEVNPYEDINCADEYEYEELIDEIEAAELVYSTEN